MRDPRNLAILLGQVPLIALGIALLFKADVFKAGGDTNNAALLLFLFVTVDDLARSDRRRARDHQGAGADRARAAVGVKFRLLASKVVVLCGLVAVQAACSAITLGLRPLSTAVGRGAFVVLAATGFVWVAMGLLISSRSFERTRPRASSRWC